MTPSYPVSADRLFALITEVAASQPRTYPAAVYPDRLQADYVVRSLVFNFPDLVVVQVDRSGADSSFLIIYSRSVYGRSDFGVNRRRVDTWLAVLKAKIPLPIER